MSDTSIMPLVDEVHRLRNENALLKRSLEEQAVRMDGLLQSGHQTRIAYLKMEVSTLEARRHETSQSLERYMAMLLADGLMREAVMGRIAYKSDPGDGGIVYAFAFHDWSRR